MEFRNSHSLPDQPDAPLVSLDAVDGTLVSVIVPAFNAAHTIAETLCSVAKQTHRSIEILIVDDGSTDITRSVVAAFCESEPRARFFAQSNAGVAVARMRGIDEAKGTFIAAIDADDIWHSEFISDCLDRALATRAALVFSLYRRIDYKSTVLWSGPLVEVQGTAVRQMLYANLVGNGSGLLMRRSAVLAVGGYNGQLRAAGLEGTEDYLLQLRIAAAYPIACVPRYLVGYRQHAGAMSNDVEQMIKSEELAIRIFRTAVPELSVPRVVWRWRRSATLLTLARYRLRRGKIGGVLRAVVLAIWLDPRGSAAIIDHDVRRIARKLGAKGAIATGSQFSLVDNADNVERTRHDWRARLKQERLRDLSILDRNDMLRDGPW